MVRPVRQDERLNPGERPIGGEPRLRVDPEDRAYRRSGYSPEDDADDLPPRSAMANYLVAGLVVVACASTVWYLWEHIHRGVGGAVPVIAAEPGPYKIAPADQDNTVTTKLDDTPIYGGGSGKEPEEHLLPPPDTPLPKPVAPAAAASGATSPTVAPQTATAPPVGSATVISPTAGATAAPAASSPAPVVAPTPPPAAALKPVPQHPAATPVTTPAPAPAEVSSASAAGGWRVQIAATRDPDSARGEWQRLSHVHAALLGSLTVSYARADVPDKGTFWRVRAGPIASREAAAKLCSDLKAVNVGCMLVKP